MARTAKMKLNSAQPRVALPRRQGGANTSDALKWRLNWLLLLGTVLLVAVVAPVAYGWHALQFNRNAAMFLSRADELEQEGKWSESLEYLNRYRRALPQDVDIRIRLAQTFDHIADEAPEKTPTSERLYAIAIGLAPDRADLRIRHAERLIETGQYRAARDEVNEVTRLDPSNRQAPRLQALAAFGDAKSRSDLASAADLPALFEAAIAQHEGEPEHVQLAIQLAEILRRASSAEGIKQADAAIQQMVAKNPQNADAWIGRYLYDARYSGSGMSADLDRALELDTARSNINVQLAAAERAHALKQSAEAIGFLEQVISAHPNDHRGYAGLAQQLAADQKYDEARQTLRNGIKNVHGGNQIGLEIGLASMSLAAGKFAEADEAIRSAARRVDVLAARQPGPGIHQIRGELSILRAQWHMEQQQYPAAIGLFQQALIGQTSITGAQEVAQRARTFMQLGACYAAIRHWDQAGDAFKEAISLQPNALVPRLAAAQAWQSAGRIDEALRDFRQAVKLPDATPEAWAYYIEAQIRQQLTLAEPARDWRAVDESLAAGQKQFPNAEALTILGVQLVDIRTGAQKTLQTLVKAQAADPKSRELAERLVYAYEAEKQPELADRVVAAFESATDDKTNAEILRSSLLMLRRNFSEAEKVLAAAITQSPPERKSELQIRQANVALRLGKVDDARKLLTAVASSGESDEILLELLADLALETQNLDDLAHWESELQKQEGPDGTAWRFYRAQRLLTQSTASTDERLTEVERLVADIQRIRPRWSMGFLLQGQLAQRRQQPEIAIDAYRKSIDLGGSHQFAREELINLLYASGKLDEAEKCLADIGAGRELSPRLASIAIALRLHRGDTPQAIELAQKEVERRPNDAMSHVSLGQTLLSAKQSAQAETAFRKATLVQPQDTRAWQALFGYYLTVDKRAAARQALDDMVRAVKLTDLELLPLLARDQMLMGDASAAEQSYRKLLVIAGEDGAILKQVADFFFDRDPALAEQCLRKAADLAPDAAAPRLNLVAYLIAKGDPKQLENATKLLESEPSTAAGAPRELGLKAQLLLRRGLNNDRAKGQRMLEELVALEQASDADRQSLITLYEADGQARKSEEQALALASRKSAHPDHLARYIELLLAHHRAAEVPTWLDKLAQVAPESWVTLNLRAQFLATEGKTADIETMIEAELGRQRARQDDKAQAQLLLAAATLYAEVKMDRQADRTFRQLASLSPDGYRPLAFWLASHEHGAEAIEICLESAKDNSPDAAAALARSMVMGGASAELAERADQVLNKALTQHPKDRELLFAVATWRLVQGQNRQAEELLRQVLVIESRNAMAMNNLATLLAEDSATRDEALQLLDQAIAISGPLAELLDSKGMVLLAQGDSQGAVALLDKAVARPAPDPRHFFHLALALRKDGRKPEARQMLEQARRHALNSAVMSPTDRRALAELAQELQSDTTPG